MIDFLCSPLEEYVVGLNKNLLVKDEQNYNVVSFENPKDVFLLDPNQLNQNNFFIHPLSSAVSSPIIFRSTHYRNVYNDTSMWMKLLDKVLTEGEEVISGLKGADFAEDWFFIMKNNATELVRTGNHNSVVLGSSGLSLSKTTKGKTTGVTSWNDELHLSLGKDKFLPIGERIVENRFQRHSSELSGFIPIKPEFGKLISLLDKFINLDSNSFFKNHHHLYYWLDKSLEDDKEFFELLIENYVRDSSQSRTQSAYVVIVVDFSRKGSINLSPLEKIALQRIDYSESWMLISKSIRREPDPNRMKQLLTELCLQPELISRHTDPFYLESDTGLQRKYFAILLKCDVGSWIGSRELDGEQVMTNN